MKCYVDAGNSRIKWQIGPKGVVSALDWSAAADWVTELGRQAQESGVTIRHFVIASVAPEGHQDLLRQQLEAAYPEVPVHWISSRARCCGIRLGYRDVSEFGVDRFCALVAARLRFPKQAVIVINAGTALTLDYMKADGVHVGGVIMPSVHAMQTGLSVVAPNLAPYFAKSALPDTRRRRKQSASSGDEDYLARDTHAALELGCRWMLAAAVNQMVSALVEGGAVDDPQVVISGGGGGVLLPLLDTRALLVPDLVMEGIVRAAQQRR